MELSSSDDLGQFLHICRLDVYNIETLVLYVEVPEIDAQIVAADECFPVAIH